MNTRIYAIGIITLLVPAIYAGIGILNSIHVLLGN